MVAQVNLHYFKTRPTKLVSRLVSYALFEGRPVTTRGQWVNPLIFAHFFLEKLLPQIRQIEGPLFILGTGRSGTTILGVVLSMHKEVGFLNEPKAIWHSVYPDEDVIGSYSRGIAHYRLDSRDVNEEVKHDAHRLFGAYLASVFSKRVVDKYPELVFRVPFVRQIFPDAKFIFLVRNGWDTCASIDKWSARCGEQKNGEVHDWWGVNRRKWKLLVSELIEPDRYFSEIIPIIPELKKHTDMAALEWVVTMREGLRRMDENGDCIRMVRYEDLVDSPRQVLAEIAQFADLSEDETYLQYGEETLKTAPQHAEYTMHPALRPLFDETMQALGYK
ncbi:MAG: sulfotransferase [Gammaproteobacteria bacterium]|nr:sulfotransferase [Gammaproteobacteria bacterium]